LESQTSGLTIPVPGVELTINSASPLNGEAAELWDKDAEEFKKKVLGRHRDVDDE
jgi:ubiquitin-protein ligase